MPSPQQQQIPQQQDIIQQPGNDNDNKFTKQMQDKFMKDLQNIQIGDSDSQLQASGSDFYQTIKKRVNAQITTMRQSTTTNMIIQQLKATLTKQLTNAEEFQQQQIKQLKYLNTQAAQSAITEEKIIQIRSKLKQESNNNVSKIVLSEVIVQEEMMRESKMDGGMVEFQDVDMGEQQGQQQQKHNIVQNSNKTKRPMLKKQQKASTLLSSSSSASSKQKLTSGGFKKKSPLLLTTNSSNNTNNQVNKNIQKRMNEINLQRERINMQRQDDRSMRYQKYWLSEFFRQRFINFVIPKTETILGMGLLQNDDNTNSLISISITKPKPTFSNLQPLQNNQKNVLPMNSPQIALKALKKNKRVQLKATSQTAFKIEFKKISIQNQQLSLNKVNLLQKENNYNNYFNNNKKLQPQPQHKQPQKQQHEQNFTYLLQPYLFIVQPRIKQLHQISNSYKPKFIRNHLNENQKISNIAINNDDQSANSNGKQRSIQQIISYQQDISSLSKLKQFKLTFQSITSIKGIQKLTSVQYIALQYNQIKQITQLKHANTLIQLNLSNNMIKQSLPINNLKQLRYLNLSNNKIREFAFTGGQLEILDLRKNNVQIVTQLNNNKYLRIINLAQNKLHQLGTGFSKLYYLQQLILTKNYIQSLTGIQCLLMLQQLDLSYNRLKQININVVYLFLNMLDLSYNQLQNLPGMFLPSLERLYVTNNKLMAMNGGGGGQNNINNVSNYNNNNNNKKQQSLYYLPQLKQLNLDDNQLKGFSTVWQLIAYSRKLQIIKYDSNQYFLSVREKVRQLYQAIIYKNMLNIKIINHSPYDTGIKAYYESVYGSYLERTETLFSVQGRLKHVQQLISCLLEENKIIANLQDKYNTKIYNQRFIQQQVFIKAKSISRALVLQKVCNMLCEQVNIPNNKLIKTSNIKSGNKQTINSTTKATTNTTTSLIEINQQIYFYHDVFQHNILQKIHKIKTLFYKLKYKRQKRNKYFIKHKPRLLALFKPIQHYIINNKLKHIITKFSHSIKKNRQLSATIMIQKHWRGYRSRKLFKRLLKKLKQKNVQDDDDFDMQEVDLDQFQAHDLPEFNFDLPEDINFDNYIIEPKYFQIAQEKETKRRQLSKHTDAKQNKNLQQISQQHQQHQQYEPMMNNFVKKQQQQKQKQSQKIHKKQQDDKLMKQWGFQNPATLQALRWKKKRKEEMKKKQAQQNMTAAQRYEKFKMMHK